MRHRVGPPEAMAERSAKAANGRAQSHEDHDLRPRSRIAGEYSAGRAVRQRAARNSRRSGEIGIAVGDKAALQLEVPHRLAGLRTELAVGLARIMAERQEALLDFLALIPVELWLVASAIRPGSARRQ